MAKRKLVIKALVLVAVLSFGVLQASASVIGVDLGTGLPPATLGGFTMAAYEPGTIGGESYTAHEVAGNGTDGWLTWGQLYTGAVHVCLDACAGGTLSLTLGGSVSAIYFY